MFSFSSRLRAVNFSSLFRPVCSLFSNSLLVFQAVSSSFPNFLVPFERFAPCSQLLYSFSSAMLLWLKFSSPFRAVCSLFTNSLDSFFERFAPVFSKSQVPFGRFAQCFQALTLSLVLKFCSLFQAVCSLFLIFQFLSLVLLFVHESSNPFSRGLLIVLSFSRPVSFGVLRVLKLSSLFRVVCSLFSTSLVSNPLILFRAVCSLF